MRWRPEKIKEFRKRLGITQKTFGDLIGVTRMYVIYLEGGGRKPGKTMQILLDLLEQKENEKGKGGMKHGKRDL